MYMYGKVTSAMYVFFQQPLLILWQLMNEDSILIELLLAAANEERLPVVRSRRDCD